MERTGKHHVTSAQGRGRERQVKHGWSRERFCEYLRAQRDLASLSIEDIAKVTKIPERSLRQLEAGKFEELPADVFVRGFLRSYARCVRVDADELIRRYSQCGALEPPPVASELARTAAEQLKALAAAEAGGHAEVGAVRAAPVEPVAAEVTTAHHTPAADTGYVDASDRDSSDDDDDVEIATPSIDESPARTASAPVRAHGAPSRKKRRRRRHRGGDRPAVDAAVESTPAPATVEPAAAAQAPVFPNAGDDSDAGDDNDVGDQSDAGSVEAMIEIPPTRPVAARRETSRQRAFLPPAWSETEEAGRRGPLTLAVIILVIVATLTMSYLLRRPSYSGDGVTQAPESTPSASTRTLA